MMKVYEIEDGCSYWVAASNVREAADAYFACLKDTCAQPDGPEDGFNLSEMAEKKSRAVTIRIDDDPHNRGLGLPEREKVSAWQLAQEATKAEVIGCSEW